MQDLVLKNRSYRRFGQGREVPAETLRELVDLARLTPSGANLQPLRYLIANSAERNDKIFPCLAWAGYLKEWGGPKEGERPSAYILILCDTTISADGGCDHGIAAQTILLGAAEKGLGGCMIGSVDRGSLAQILQIPAQYKILLVLALGWPTEKVVLEDVAAGQSIRYYRDGNQVHHVPKRRLDDIIVDFGS